MALGSAKHSRRKVAAQSKRDYARNVYAKKANVTVRFWRTDDGKFEATACIKRRGGMLGGKTKCGRPMFASTPTKAFKKALSSLAKSTR
jgi:hypothetical protein